jgi:CheY-like chemotaxis protein
VLDLHLPRLGGDVVLQELAANPQLRGTPVIVVTGADPRPAIAQTQAILRKPCEPERLIEVIEEHLAA